MIKLRDLAKVLNTTYATINAYETGKTPLLTAFAIELAKNITFLLIYYVVWKRFKPLKSRTPHHIFIVTSSRLCYHTNQF